MAEANGDGRPVPMFAGYRFEPQSGTGLYLSHRTLEDLLVETDELAKAGVRTKAVKQRIGQLFNLWHSIWTNMVQWGAADKARFTPTHRFLREAARKSLIDSLIVNARMHQMRHVSRRVVVDGKQKGWNVVHRHFSDPNWKATKQIQARCDEMETLLEKGVNREVHPGGFRDFLLKAVQGELVIDRKAMVMLKGIDGKPRSFHLLPPDDIKPRFEVLLSFMAQHPGRYPTPQDAMVGLWETERVDLTDKAYVQVLDDGRVSGAWTADEMSIDITAPSDEINRYGFGVSCLERSLEATSILMMALNYNKCLHRRTEVDTDAGRLEIARIVNRRLPVRVRSYDRETGRFQWARVTDWQRYPTWEWIEVTYAGPTKRRTIRATPNHKLLTARGMVEAGRLAADDTLYVPGPGLSAVQRQVILGGLLGDGALNAKRAAVTPQYIEHHGPRQREYAAWKARALGNLGVTAYTRRDGAASFCTRSSAALLPYLRLCYGGPGRRKRITAEWLGQLAPQGLAVWLMDDGHVHRTNWTRGSLVLGLALHPLDKDEVEAVAEFFERRFGAPPILQRDARHRGWLARFTVATSAAILAAVAPHLGVRTRPDGSVEKAWRSPEAQHGPAESAVEVPILAIRRVSCPRRQWAYDITVEPTHTFLANDCVSSNSNFTANYPEAFLVFNGEVDAAGLEAFKKQMYAEVGPYGNQRLPVIATGSNELNKAQLLKLRDSLRDMQFPMLVRMAVALKCSAYRAHPSLVNFAPDSGGQRPVISSDTQETQIALAQEEGLHSILDNMGAWLTRALVEPWYDDLELVWSVQDQPTEAERIEVAQRKLAMGQTVDEWRATEGLPTLADATGGQVEGGYVNSPFFFQAQQAKQQEEMAAQQQAMAAMGVGAGASGPPGAGEMGAPPAGPPGGPGGAPPDGYSGMEGAPPAVARRVRPGGKRPVKKSLRIEVGP